jgi:tetratricopeptide (TPR) repeat protein
MKRVRNHSSLLSKYSLMYEKKPRSRVFAPLAETYRKLGMIDESMNILKDGIKNHPSYTLGYIVLAHCYFDLQNYEMSYNSIRPFVSQNLENITLQKLFAKTCINLGYLEEALQTFKYLLLINPKDVNVAEQIKLLEDDLLVNNDLVEEPTEIKNNLSSFDEDEWVQVDFYKERDEKQLDEKPLVDKDEIDDWNVAPANKSPLDSFKNEIKENNIEVKHHTLDDEYFHEEFDNESKAVILPVGTETNSSKKEKVNVEGPIITHTLVDLYYNQGHLDKAASILENILDLHPDDEATKNRLDEITLELVGNIVKEEKIEPVSEQLSSFEVEAVNTINRQEEKINLLKNTFELFENKLRHLSSQKLAKI